MSEKKLPPYNEDSLCPKCGHDKATTVYQEEVSYRVFACNNRTQNEHLHRRCTRCHYSWCEDIVRPSGAREE